MEKEPGILDYDYFWMTQLNHYETNKSFLESRIVDPDNEIRTVLTPPLGYNTDASIWPSDSTLLCSIGKDLIVGLITLFSGSGAVALMLLTYCLDYVDRCCCTPNKHSTTSV